MVPFRRLTLLFFITLLSLNLWNIFYGKSAGGFVFNHAILLYGLLITTYFGVSFAMAFLPCSNFHHHVICGGVTDDHAVSITFDDGPDPVKTPLILKMLEKHDVKATFFQIGKHLTNNEQLVKQMVEEEHLVGNHSYSHSNWFDLFSPDKIRSELLETDRLIKNITGKSPLFFRPPFGVVNPLVSMALKNMHWKTICWNIRSLDTMKTDPRKIKEKILRKLKPGAIILLHDTTPFTEHHLEALLTAIKNAGYKIVPLDILLKLPAYAS
ncbi:MAG: polysaccharide deacetylase family protein [Bacteroidetes bacterium]|nr:polysaccharide deacetylase family protein [Bacteroidota bacterium]